VKRWPLRISLCLILITGGAITTVAVAWGIWKTADWDQTAFDYLVDINAAEPLQVHCLATDEFGTLWIWSFTARAKAAFSDVPPWSVAGTLVKSLALAQTWEFNEYAYGWPALCIFERELVRGMANASSNTSVGWHPIWPGFVIDTLFYAAIWGGVWFGFVGGKRFIRTKRGRCPRCGYDLRGGVRVEPPATSPGCPERGWNRAQEETERLREGETK
jgi:hypothetical protein